MMKTATITFHASHNYGSMLQAMALQQTIKSLGYDNEIINFRTSRQIRMYSVVMASPFHSIKSFVRFVVKNLFYTQYYKDSKTKYQVFEQFLFTKLDLTKEYSKLEQLYAENFLFDCYITGGDQIWNTSPEDFDWSYYLPFVKRGKRISYAVSMGPRPRFTDEDKCLIHEYLDKFDYISVREQGTHDVVNSITAIPVTQTLDPAFLLTKKQWQNQIADEPIVKGDYILLYSPAYNEEVYNIAKILSKKLKIPVVNTIFYWTMLKDKFNHQLAVGPLEFVNLVAHAKLVVSGSFHALVFSVIFNKPFFAVNGDKDNRMISFLNTIQLQDRTINITDYEKKVADALLCDFTIANNHIAIKRTESLKFLQNAIIVN